jgi:hypothetical protein
VRGMRRIAAKKPPKERKGLDDPAHKKAVRSMPCLLRGKTCEIGGWFGTYPKRWVVQTYKHICIGNVEPHHSTKKAQRGHDHTCVPLCHGAHREADLLTNEQFKERWGIALPVIASKLAPRPSREET